jgi:Peroxisomal biogenesis factor 11 (PEX11)
MTASFRKTASRTLLVSPWKVSSRKQRDLCHGSRHSPHEPCPVDIQKGTGTVHQRRLQESSYCCSDDTDDDMVLVHSSSSPSCSDTSDAHSNDSDDDCMWDPESQYGNETTLHSYEYRNDECKPLHETVEFPIATGKQTHVGFPHWNKAKDWLVFYVNFTSLSGNQEKLLKLLQWSLWMIGACIGFQFPIAGLEFGAWLQKMSCDVCYARYVTRLLGLPSAVEGAITGSWAVTSSDNQRLDQVYRVFGKILAIVMIGYYPTELVAFALWMKPTANGTVFSLPADTWFYWSMRFWLVYLITELVQSCVQYAELNRQRSLLFQRKKTDTIATPPLCNAVQQLRSIDAQMNSVRILLVCDSLYLLPCLHWSLPASDTQPWLPLTLVSSLMWAESVVCLYHALSTAT